MRKFISVKLGLVPGNGEIASVKGVSRSKCFTPAVPPPIELDHTCSPLMGGIFTSLCKFKMDIIMQRCISVRFGHTTKQVRQVFEEPSPIGLLQGFRTVKPMLKAYLRVC